MKQKRNTKQRSLRTAVQGAIGVAISAGLTEAVPYIQEGNMQLAAIAFGTFAIGGLVSAAQNWLDNQDRERTEMES